MSNLHDLPGYLSSARPQHRRPRELSTGTAEPTRPWLPRLGSGAGTVCADRATVTASGTPTVGGAAGEWSWDRRQLEAVTSGSINSCFSAPNYLLLPLQPSEAPAAHQL